MQSFILISILGVLGVLCRFGVDTFLGKLNEEFPVATLIVNLFGSLLAGTIYALAAHKNFSSVLQTGLLVGFCGGFTTFSAYTLQTMMMLERGRVLPAFTYLFVSPCLGLLAAFVPVLLIRILYE